MAPQTFAQIIIILSAIAAGFSLFLNFLLLLMEEMKNYSIMNRKKERKHHRGLDGTVLFRKKPGAMMEI